jgi:HK97 family phage prohead protease
VNRFGVELRAEVDGNRLAGHAAVFDVHAQMPGHWEPLSRSAFDEVLSGDPDVKALFNHNPSLILGSTRAKTLRLETDDVGLAFEVDLPDTSYARDLKELVAREDVRGCSFGFLPGADRWSRAPDGGQLRTHTSVKDLLDVSLVAYPAYDGTEVHLRSVNFAVPVHPTARQQLIRLRAAYLLREVT